MARLRKGPLAGAADGCCRVDSLVGIDERGQMVLPKKLREKAGIRAGDHLAVASWESGGQVCCLFLVKADRLAELLQGMLGPLMKGMEAR